MNTVIEQKVEKFLLSKEVTNFVMNTTDAEKSVLFNDYRSAKFFDKLFAAFCDGDDCAFEEFEQALIDLRIVCDGICGVEF